MKELFFIIILCLIWINSFSQTNYTWHIQNINSIDSSAVTKNYYFPNTDINLDFDKVISEIKPNRYPDSIVTQLNFEIDSLKKLNQDSIIQNTIFYLEDMLQSVFRIIKIDKYELALLFVDTLKIKNNEFLIYIFETDFTNEWNEDHHNWFIYYTKEFGLIRAYLHCSMMDKGYPCYTEVTQLRNSNLKASGQFMLNLVVNRAKKLFNPVQISLIER